MGGLRQESTGIKKESCTRTQRTGREGGGKGEERGRKGGGRGEEEGRKKGGRREEVDQKTFAGQKITPVTRAKKSPRCKHMPKNLHRSEKKISV
jgi:hypothetical protein